jgi:hypothetical protein
MNATTNALRAMDSFSPAMQAKIDEWYPKIEAAQRVARLALGQMMIVLSEHPISITDEAYKVWGERRQQIVANYEKSWAEYQALIKGFNDAVKAPAPAPGGQPVAAAASAASALTPSAAPAPAARRSPRLATKPRINYEEAELEEEREARETKKAERRAKRKAKAAEREDKATEKKAVEAELEEAEKELISTPSSQVNSYMWALQRRARLQDRLAELEGAEKKAVEQFPSFPSLPPLPSLPGF